MNRIKWLNAEWPFTMRTLGNKLKAISFNEESIDGFVIERIREDFIEGRFIEKYSFQEIVLDPFGKEEVVERAGYHSTNFKLYADFPFIELINGQRNIKELLGRLLEVCNFNLTVSPINVDLINWVDEFHRLFNQKIIVDSIQLSGVKLDDGITGKILLKGDRDVRDAIDNILKGKRYILEKLQIKLDLYGRKVSVHLGNNGTVKLHHEYTSELLPLFRKSLTNKINIY